MELVLKELSKMTEVIENIAMDGIIHLFRK